MKIEWLQDLNLPDSVLHKMQQAADRCPECEGIQIPCAASVRLCSDETIAEINRIQRGIDHATDVLSFPSVRYPAGATAGSCEQLLRREYDDEADASFLGDIVISVPHIYSQAAEYGHSVGREAAYLLVHGLCHLMGYDHMEPDDKQKMRRKEEEILSGIEPSPDAE